MARLGKTIEQLTRTLAELWPECFVVYGPRRRPLKLGIREDLRAAGIFTDAELAAVLHAYTREVGYLKACGAGTPRIGLDGAPAGNVTTAEAQSARIRLTDARQGLAKEHPAAQATKAPPPVKVDRMAQRKPGQRPILSLPGLRRKSA